MNQLIFVAILMVAFFVLLYWFRLRYEVEGIHIYSKEKKIEWSNLILLLGAAFLIKLVIAAIYEGHGTDMNCFSAWSDMIFQDGFWDFYHSDTFTDYPPGYMALLWIVGAMRSFFELDTNTGIGRVVIKFIPILFDLGAGVLLYRIAKRKFSEASSLFLSVTYVLNPIVVLDSSAWGQVDGAVTFFILLVCYLCMEEKRIGAYFAFVAGVLIKPQMLMFAPILIWTIIEQVFLKNFNTKKMLRDLVGGISAIAAMVVFTLPFGTDKVFEQYINTLSSYPYCTINAYNFWALIGQNWQSQQNTLFGVSASTWGSIAILVSVALSGFIFFKHKDDKSRYFTSMAVLIANMFIFSVRMHERYMFPAVALLLAAFLIKPTKELFFAYVGFSFVQFINVGHVLYTYIEENGNTVPQGSVIGITAILTILMFAYLIYATFSKGTLEDLKESAPRRRKKNTLNYIIKNPPKKEKEQATVYHQRIRGTYKPSKFTKWDWIVLVSIMVVYSIFAFYDLGDMDAPQTNYSFTEDDTQIDIDLGEDKDIGMVYTYLGSKEDRLFTLQLSQDGESYEEVGTVKASSVFAWDAMKTWDADTETEGEKDYNLLNKYRYLRLICTNDLSNEICVLNELVITDTDGNVITPVNTSDYEALFDEQELFEPQEDTPETAWTATDEGTTVTIDLGADHYFDMLHAYSKDNANMSFKVEVAKSEGEFSEVGELISGEADGWSKLREVDGDDEDIYSFTDDTYRYIRLTTLQADTSLDEIVVTDSSDTVMTIYDHEGGDELFDEQDGYNKAITFRSGTYFDEIYHARTAYEIIQGMSHYEWTHPPLGKVFISLGIRIFGMCPFGWRVVGVLFGIAMLPFMYMFGRRLFRSRTWAAGALTFLFAFDFMHFTQTRIATIDVYGTFFVIAMYFFMYWYSQTSFYDTKLWKTFIPLGLSAIMMGLGCASKWTAVYASAGLAVFFFAIMGWRGYEYYLAKKDPDGESDGISHAHIIKTFKKKLAWTLGFCVLFFVVIAGSIYIGSYTAFEDDSADNTERFVVIDDPDYTGFDWDETCVSGLVGYLRAHSGEPVAETVGKMLANQHSMYTYHHDLTATHPYESSWNEWPVMIKPMYYYCQTLSNGLKEGISAFGNPLVWWAGIPALILILFPWGRKRRIAPRLGGETAQWLQCAVCEFCIFLALWSKYMQSDADDTWKIYGPFCIVLGTVAALYLAWQLISRGERRVLFMVFAYAVQFLPWVLVPRCTFAYHYFPSVPFVAMIIVYCMVRIVDYDKRWFKWCMVYLAVAFLLFVLFYPVLSGQGIIYSMVRDGLRWMEGWQLVS